MARNRSGSGEKRNELFRIRFEIASSTHVIIDMCDFCEKRDQIVMTREIPVLVSGVMRIQIMTGLLADLEFLTERRIVINNNTRLRKRSWRSPDPGI
jgi:hypothetical protein